jgi:Domain of unknown function (DUF222)/HNH endonuclease
VKEVFETFSPQRPDQVCFGPVLSAVGRNVPSMSSAALRPTATDEVVARLRAVSAQYAEMAELPVFALTDARLDARLSAALRARAAADEMVTRIAAEADAAGVADRAGASSTRAWLIGKHGMSPRDAARTVGHASAMAPATEATRLAWARGEICGDKAEVISAAVTGLPADLDPRRAVAAQADLVARASTMTVGELRREASRLVDQVVDPDQAAKIRQEKLAEQARSAYEQATFRGRKGLDGIATFSGTMPNLAFDMLTASLDAIASPRRDHLRGDDEAAQGEQVPYANRLGRALCDLVEKIDARDVPSHGVNATLVVTIDEQSLRDRVGAAALASGDEIPVEELRRLACNADILPMVLGSDSQPVNLGRASRLFSKGQKTALAARDGGCVFPGCERPPGWTEAHHVQPWSAGGDTDLSNGALLCGFHHRLVHRDDGWQIRIAPDGLPEVIPPTRVDRKRRPIRHSRHRHRQRPRPEAA